MGDEPVVYLCIETAAKRLGCSRSTVRRVAKSRGYGIQTDNKRIVAVAAHELPLIKPHVHETAGNPVWIAAGKEAKRKAKRPAPGRRSKPA